MGRWFTVERYHKVSGGVSTKCVVNAGKVHHCRAVKLKDRRERDVCLRDHDVGVPTAGKGEYLADLGIGVRTGIPIAYVESSKPLPYQPGFHFSIRAARNIDVDVGGRPVGVGGRQNKWNVADSEKSALIFHRSS